MTGSHSILRLRKFVLIFVILLTLPLHAYEINKYHNYAELSAIIKEIARNNPNLVKLKSLDKTIQKRDIWLITISDKSTGNVDKKPAILIVANLEGNQVIGSELLLGLVDRLVENAAKDDTVKQLLASKTIYIIPRLNPDGAEKMFVKPLWESATTITPIDDDHDGFIDEDPPNDLNGDGLITFIRVKEPGGEYIPHPKDNRLLKKADPAKKEVGIYNIFVEGKDDDGDKTFNEDPVGGVDLNRNFPFGYEYFAKGTGVHPVSEVETRALANFIHSHENIVAILTFSANDNLINPPKEKVDAEKSEEQHEYEGMRFFQRKPLTQVDPKDVPLYKFISEKYKELTGIKTLPVETKVKGAFSDYGYFDWGILSLATPGWAIPEPPKKEKANTTAAPKDSGKVEVKNELKQEKSDAGKKTMAKGKGEKDEQQAEINLLKWFDRDSLERFVEWQAIPHPDFPDREVEIGGFQPFAKTNPPTQMIEDLTAKHCTFITELVQLFPQVEIESFKVEKKTADVVQLKAVISNTGFLPTNTQLGSKMRLNRPTKVELKLNGQELLSGKRLNFIKRLESLGGNTTFIWTIKGKGTVTLSVDSPKSGKVTKSTKL